VRVTAPSADEFKTTSGGFDFYWTAQLAKWDGRNNRWLPSEHLYNDDVYASDRQWNHYYVMQSYVDFGWYPTTGTQSVAIPYNQSLYTAAFVRTWYLVGNRWFGGNVHYVHNDLGVSGLYLTPHVNGWCYFS
jgi:hypothetical protein